MQTQKAKQEATWKSYVECPRWASIKKALAKGAMNFDVDVDITNEEIGWLRHFVAFTVSGEAENVQQFRDALIKAMKEWNDGDKEEEEIKQVKSKKKKGIHGNYLGYNYYVLPGPFSSEQWNGYVEVNKKHPFYEVNYNTISNEMPDLEVHGGLTFSGKEVSGVKTKGWLIGFDTCHFSDWSSPNDDKNPDKHKWTIQEVEQETKHLIEQIKKYRKINSLGSAAVEAYKKIASPEWLRNKNEKNYWKNLFLKFYKKELLFGILSTGVGILIIRCSQMDEVTVIGIGFLLFGLASILSFIFDFR